MSATESNSPGTDASRSAACLKCRRSKVKCIRDPGSTVCKRCDGSGNECVIPEYHVGRYKGVPNKRHGLEKAIYQVEQALKRSKSNGVTFDHDTDVDLRQLINQSQTLAKQQQGHRQLPAEDEMPPDHPEKADEIALDNADNPLQLLAMASAMPNQSPASAVMSSPAVATTRTPTHAIEADDTELQSFFGSMTPVLDNSHDTDAVELGFVTEEEAESLFKYFYEHLSHTRWGLDPLLHTASFVRSRSAFLYGSVLAAAAAFHANTAALAKRLSTHRDQLAQKVLTKGHRSVEIVLAFMVNIPWMSPAKHWAEDKTCTYLAMALTLALDLQLNRIVVPSSTIRPQGFLDRVAKSDCIDATKALQLDGFPQVDPSSACGKRLLRTRERVYLALFTLDRGVCLARGRPYAVPTGPLVDSCDTWHVSDIADEWDGCIISTSVLRRDLVGLINTLREACDNSQSTSIAISPVKYLKDRIDRFFDQWHTAWEYQIAQRDGRIPPYVAILVSHTKLSTYCSVINHPTATSDVKQFFRAAGLQSALNVMRVAVEGEARLKSMPNNTVIMVSFAACFALGLSTISEDGNRKNLSPQLRRLVEQTAQVLERIGSTPKHRIGTSALFGRHIRRILRTSFPEQPATPVADIPQEHMSSSQTQLMPPPYGPATQEPYTFDMTDDQIIDAINNASRSQELFQLDENVFLDWLEWPSAT